MTTAQKFALGMARIAAHMENIKRECAYMAGAAALCAKWNTARLQDAMEAEAKARMLKDMARLAEIGNREAVLCDRMNSWRCPEYAVVQVSDKEADAISHEIAMLENERDTLLEAVEGR